MMHYLTEQQIGEMAMAVLSTIEFTPTSHQRQIEIAVEHSIDEWGIKPNHSAALLAVKKANLGWQAIQNLTKEIIQ